MPSGKRAKQQRRAAAPPPVRSKKGKRVSGGMSRRTLLIIAGIAVGVLIGVGVGLALGLSSSGGPHASASSGRIAPLSTLGHLEPSPPLGPPGPEAPPIESGPNLAPAGSPPPGGSVDGISCQGSEQLVYHIHARLTIFVNGRSKRVPYGVGIADPQTVSAGGVPFVVQGSCFSWLHTHAADGIIHIESPVQRTYTLGNFFDVWGQPLSRRQVGPANGHVTALFNGKVWLGDLRDIPLDSHAQIQLEVGRPLVAPVHITNWGQL
jgi:hypothetical protein